MLDGLVSSHPLKKYPGEDLIFANVNVARKAFGQKSIGAVLFSQHSMIVSFGSNVRTSNVTINWSDGS